MEVTVKTPDASVVRPQNRTADDLVHLIRKLRWMGMEEEAEVLQARLADCDAPPRANVIGGPTDTD